MFKLVNQQNEAKKAHAGVAEFVAEEGRCYIPYWMMQNLGLSEGQFLRVSSVTLPRGEFVKFQPESAEFFNLSNPRAVLEALLRNHSALGKGERICLLYNNKEWWLIPKEVRPLGTANAVSIVETDIQVEFEEPENNNNNASKQEDTKTPETQIPEDPTLFSPLRRSKMLAEEGVSSPAPLTSPSSGAKIVPFTGSGQTLSGKPRTSNLSTSSEQKLNSSANLKKSSTHAFEQGLFEDSDSEGEQMPKDKKFLAFSGSGQSLKKKN